MGEDPLVDRRRVRDQEAECVRVGRAPTAAGALPERADRAGEAHDDHRIEGCNVDAQLERRGRRDPAQAARRLGEITPLMHEENMGCGKWGVQNTGEHECGTCLPS